MRAAVVREFGGPDRIQVEDLPVPVPDASEVRVRVHYAPVNPTDLMLRSGLQAKAFESVPQPWIPGLEFSGVIDEVGTAGGPWSVGDAVMGIVNPRRAKGGSQAELVLVSAADVAAVPSGVALEAASMIPMNGLTAGMIIERLEPDPSKTVLVTGAAGILGGYVVQLAKRAGMSVIALGRLADQSFLEGLGATAIAAEDGDFVDQVRGLAPHGVDGLVDAANFGERAEAVLKDGGISVQVLPKQLPQSSRIVRRTLSVLDAYGAPGTLSDKVRTAGLDVLSPRVAQLTPLAEVSQAHETVQSGSVRGRVILDLTGD